MTEKRAMHLHMPPDTSVHIVIQLGYLYDNAAAAEAAIHDLTKVGTQSHSFLNSR